MAYSFNSATPDFLDAASAVVSGPPFSVSCFFNSTDTANAQVLVYIGQEAVFNNQHLLRLRGDVGADPLEAFSRDSSTSAQARSTAGYSSGTTHHAMGIWTSATNREVWLDNANYAQDTTSVSPTGLDKTSIAHFGGSGAGQNLLASVWEVGVWNVALSANDRALLAAGLSPLLVRRDALVMYQPLVRFVNHWGIGPSFTPSGSPTPVPHGRVIMPPSPRSSLPLIAAETSSSSSPSSSSLSSSCSSQSSSLSSSCSSSSHSSSSLSSSSCSSSSLSSTSSSSLSSSSCSSSSVSSSSCSSQSSSSCSSQSSSSCSSSSVSSSSSSSEVFVGISRIAPDRAVDVVARERSVTRVAPARPVDFVVPAPK